MANVRIKPNTDIKLLKEELKSQGLILRTYHKADGEVKYTIRSKTFFAPQVSVSIPEIHERLNRLAGKEISSQDLSTLLACWRHARNKEKSGRTVRLSVAEADDFIRYAWGEKE